MIESDGAMPLRLGEHWVGEQLVQTSLDLGVASGLDDLTKNATHEPAPRFAVIACEAIDLSEESGREGDGPPS